MVVNAGHGLHYHNTRAIVALGGFHELNIGHRIMALSMFSGLEQAVHELVAAIEGGPEPTSTLEHGRAALEIAVALNRSAQTGVRVELPIKDSAAGGEAF